MAAFYVTSITSSLLQRPPFFTLSSPTLLHHLKPITSTLRMRRALMCAVSEDTVEIDSLADVLKEADPKGVIFTLFLTLPLHFVIPCHCDSIICWCCCFCIFISLDDLCLYNLW
ncbi:hypothetical protein Lalb_Chr02g0140701 [Lupinus albus]|uniref:Uncharacterized protein n=1 Tax=Lupinus albus TaxID=3870 RepID=A0A6A4QX78_LUPAL|nr:hypothetical protein Lalb_Chr02g0140701 [Lupinus albus]